MVVFYVKDWKSHPPFERFLRAIAVFWICDFGLQIVWRRKEIANRQSQIANEEIVAVIARCLLFQLEPLLAVRQLR